MTTGAPQESAQAAEPPREVLDLVRSIWQPREVWLYGSRAKGTHRQESDWDLLVVVDDDAPPALLDLATAWSATRAFRPPVEVYPVRRSEFEEGRRWLGSLAQIATSEGRRVDVR